MKLLESYAAICGVDIKKSTAPDIYEVYFPAPNKYITIQNSSGFESKNYDLWQDVIDYVKPVFDRNNIAILQLGDEKSPTLNGVLRLCGKTSMHQSNYLIRRALAHVGNDSCLNYLCAHSDTPLVSVYGPTDPRNHSPYYLPSKYKLFESHRFGSTASLSMHEHPKTINLIKPEDIAEYIFTTLGFDNSSECDFVKKHKTVYLGDFYLKQSYEYIPDHMIYEQFKCDHLIIRADISYEPSCVMHALNRFKSSLVIKAGTDLEIISRMKKNIANISCEVFLDTDKKYIEDLKKIGCKTVFFSKDEQNIAQIRNNLFHNCIVELSKKDTKESFLKKADEYNGKPVANQLDSLFFKTNKIVLSKGAAFASIEHSRHNIQLKEYNNIIDTPSFYEEAEKFKFLC